MSHFYRLWWISPLIVFIIGASFLFIALDWKYLEYKYGIKIFPDELLEITHHDGSVSTVINYDCFLFMRNELANRSKRPMENQYVNIKCTILYSFLEINF